MAEGVGDEGRQDVVPFAIGRIVVAMNGSVGCRACEDKAADDTSEGFDRAEDRVIVGTMPDAFSFDSVILVSEF